MYQLGDYVLYGIHGVCRITGAEQRMVDRKQQEYLVLEPTNHMDSKFYLPRENPSAMAKLSPVLSREALAELLQSDAVRLDCWVEAENLRKQRYRDLICATDRVALMQMACTLYRHRMEYAQIGKKFHQCDENFLKDAEKVLSSEIALVMQLPVDQAKKFLQEQLCA